MAYFDQFEMVDTRYIRPYSITKLDVRIGYCTAVYSFLQYVAAFAISANASNWDRLGKPFNPLLGETFELDK